MVIPQGFRGAATPLAPVDLAAEASSLHCGLAIIHAFSDVESGGSGYLNDGRPKVLFEAKRFHQETDGRFDKTHPNISSPIWNRALYGAGGAHQYDRLAEAMTLDREAALRSASVGRYQVMGFNFAMLDYSNIEDMWADFCNSERSQLVGFGAFITHAGLLPALRAKPPKFVELAVGYNGTGEHANLYDVKLKEAWQHYVAHGESAAILSRVAMYSRVDNPSMFGLQ